MNEELLRQNLDFARTVQERVEAQRALDPKLCTMCALIGATILQHVLGAWQLEHTEMPDGDREAVAAMLQHPIHRHDDGPVAS